MNYESLNPLVYCSALYIGPLLSGLGKYIAKALDKAIGNRLAESRARTTIIACTSISIVIGMVVLLGVLARILARPS